MRSPGAKDECMVYVRGGGDDLDVFGASAKEGPALRAVGQIDDSDEPAHRRTLTRNKKPVFATHIATGRIARGCESLACQLLNTIKVRMQLSKSGCAPGGLLALYKGLGAVLSGIVPKIAIRFGTTEAIAVVTPMEVVKMRLQAQVRSLADPLEDPQHQNTGHAVYTIVREEGIGTLRVPGNQKVCAPDAAGLEELPSYQHMLIGLISGTMDPFSNVPIDTIKTRTSAKAPATEGAWPSSHEQHLNAHRARVENEDIYSPGTQQTSDTYPESDLDAEGEPEPDLEEEQREREREREMEEDGRPSVRLAQTAENQLRHPAPLEEMTRPPPPTHPPPSRKRTKGPGWSASGAELEE
ncbi:mitochondrial carrier domain-containing protein [Mycena olivaceomarginata]|nr:mitochondrial carrier domain-containing protein [Mycena olivaceomarginata]